MLSGKKLQGQVARRIETLNEDESKFDNLGLEDRTFMSWLMLAMEPSITKILSFLKK